MQPEIVTQATALAVRIRSTNRGSSFAAAVLEFTNLLETVPDHAAGELTDPSIAMLARAGDDVIDAIEERIAAADDPPAVQLELAKAIYAIRRALEGVDRWQRHFARR